MKISNKLKTETHTSYNFIKKYYKECQLIRFNLDDYVLQLIKSIMGKTADLTGVVADSH